MIETLESRIAPAILMPTVAAGVLSIAHDSSNGTADDLTITQTSPGTFTVAEANAVQSFPGLTGVKSIHVELGGTDDTVKLELTGDGLPGNFDLTDTGGMNTFTLTTADGHFGRLLGKVTVHGAAGDDTLLIYGGLAIGGPLTFEGGDGMDTFGPSGTQLAKKVTLGSVENITVNLNAAPVVIGSLLVENEDANGAVSFVISRVATVLGALQYCGSGSATDNVTLDGQFYGPVNLMLQDGKQDAANNVSIAGTLAKGVTITGGKGDDTIIFERRQIDFSLTTPQFETATLLGALTMKLGDGTNDVTFQDGSYFGNNVTLTTGTGTDQLHGEDFIAAKKLTVSLGNGANSVLGPTNTNRTNGIGGQFKYTGGVDADSVSLSHLVLGTAAIKLGDGNNTLTSDATMVTGGTVSIVGGKNTDTVTIAISSGVAKLSVLLNAGDDTLNFTGASVASAILDGGADSDTLNGLANLPAGTTPRNFETKS
jgi:hypothetical protein